MAAGAFVFPDKAKLNMVSATDVLAGTSTNYRLALVTSAWTPAPSTDEVWADVSGNEIANGNGYTTGGGTLTGVVLNQTSGTVKFTASAFTWTASGGSIPAWRRGVVYYLGTLNSKVNPIIGYFLGDSTPADVPATTVGNTLTVTPNASGILTIA
jgi:hypothetical protein